MADIEKERPLKKIAQAFQNLESLLTSGNADIEVAAFSHACSLVSFLFGCLGFAFKFAEMDYVAKVISRLRWTCTSWTQLFNPLVYAIPFLVELLVDDLREASNSLATLSSMLDLEMKSNTLRQAGSHSRNLLRVKRGLDMVKVLFERILATDGNSLRDPATVAYEQVFAPHHGWAIRKAVGAGMYTLPTKAQLLNKLNEDEASARIQMQIYVSASAPVIQYVDNLFLSRNLGIGW